MSFLKRFWERLLSEDRRRNDRVEAPQLAIFCWADGKPVQHQVRDVSATGLYVVTEERWYPGTLIAMTLQKMDMPADNVERAVAVQSRVARWGTDGVGVEFLMPGAPGWREMQGLAGDKLDRKRLEKFLEGFAGAGGKAQIERIANPAGTPSLRG
jgi:hypothetical protein